MPSFPQMSSESTIRVVAIAREYAEVDRTEEAAQLLAQAVEIARSISPQ